jgi:hypothetical protein
MHYIAMYMGVFAITALLWMFAYVFDCLVDNNITRITLAIIEDFLAVVCLSAAWVSIMIFSIYFGGN